MLNEANMNILEEQIFSQIDSYYKSQNELSSLIDSRLITLESIELYLINDEWLNQWKKYSCYEGIKFNLPLKNIKILKELRVKNNSDQIVLPNINNKSLFLNDSNSNNNNNQKDKLNPKSNFHLLTKECFQKLSHNRGVDKEIKIEFGIFNGKLIAKYLDNIIILFKNKNKFNLFLLNFNNAEKELDMTYETLIGTDTIEFLFNLGIDCDLEKQEILSGIITFINKSYSNLISEDEKVKKAISSLIDLENNFYPKIYSNEINYSKLTLYLINEDWFINFRKSLKYLEATNNSGINQINQNSIINKMFEAYKENPFCLGNEIINEENNIYYYLNENSSGNFIKLYSNYILITEDLWLNLIHLFQWNNQIKVNTYIIKNNIIIIYNDKDFEIFELSKERKKSNNIFFHIYDPTKVAQIIDEMKFIGVKEYYQKYNINISQESQSSFKLIDISNNNFCFGFAINIICAQRNIEEFSLLIHEQLGDNDLSIGYNSKSENENNFNKNNINNININNNNININIQNFNISNDINQADNINNQLMNLNLNDINNMDSNEMSYTQMMINNNIKNTLVNIPTQEIFVNNENKPNLNTINNDFNNIKNNIMDTNNQMKFQNNNINYNNQQNNIINNDNFGNPQNIGTHIGMINFNDFGNQNIMNNINNNNFNNNFPNNNNMNINQNPNNINNFQNINNNFNINLNNNFNININSCLNPNIQRSNSFQNNDFNPNINFYHKANSSDINLFMNHNQNFNNMNNLNIINNPFPKNDILKSIVLCLLNCEIITQNLSNFDQGYMSILSSLNYIFKNNDYNMGLSQLKQNLINVSNNSFNFEEPSNVLLSIIVSLDNEISGNNLIQTQELTFYQNPNDRDSMYNEFLDKIFNPSNNTFISKNFFGIREIMTKCMKCLNLNYDFEIFKFFEFSVKDVNHFIANKLHRYIKEEKSQNFLEIMNNNSKKIITINNCFDYYSNNIGKYNNITCRKCMQKFDDVNGKNVLRKMPNYLFIIIKNTKDYSVTLKLEENINLSKISLNEKYKLISVIIISKENQNYYTLIKDKDNDIWKLYLDNNIETINLSDASKKGLPFLLLYKIKK